MKTILILLSLVFLAFSQGAMTSSVTDGNYEIYLDSALSASGADTLAAADSSIICTKFRGSNDWEYILVRDAFTGTGSDSVSVYLRSDAYDANDSLLYSTQSDSFTTSAGEASLLPWNRTQVGYKYTLKIIGYGDDGGQLITNLWQIWKRRVYKVQKSWTGSY